MNFLKISKARFLDALQEFSKSSQKYWRKNVCLITLCRWLFRKNNNTFNCDDNDVICFLILGRLLLLGSPWNKIWLKVLERSICVAVRPFCLEQSFDLQKNWRWTYVLPWQKRVFANCRDHAKILVVFKRWFNYLILCESCCSHNWPTIGGEKLANNNERLFSNWRLLEIRICKKVLLKEEILPHYQSSRFFQTYANSNKMSGPLHVRINGCIILLRAIPLLKVSYVLQNCDQ